MRAVSSRIEKKQYCRTIKALKSKVMSLCASIRVSLNVKRESTREGERIVGRGNALKRLNTQESHEP